MPPKGIIRTKAEQAQIKKKQRNNKDKRKTNDVENKYILGKIQRQKLILWKVKLTKLWLDSLI